ncbi:MAG: hypothetical protein ACK2UR_13390 [Candidatus Promineifilaceae bacterium]
MATTSEKNRLMIRMKRIRLGEYSLWSIAFGNLKNFNFPEMLANVLIKQNPAFISDKPPFSLFISLST